MTHTTVPSIVVTLIVFIILGIGFSADGSANSQELLTAMNEVFTINLFMFIVPILVIVMIVKKTPPLVALFAGTLLGALAALIFQQDLLLSLSGESSLSLFGTYQVIIDAITVSTEIETSSPELSDLFQSGGMQGMLGTIWLIICAMVFGGVMDAIGALATISTALLSMAKSTFQLFASTVASCLAINITASDQYLSIVVPGKMFEKAYQDRDLAPENLSRTLEDSGTVTSVLIPWNTCGPISLGC